MKVELKRAWQNFKFGEGIRKQERDILPLLVEYASKSNDILDVGVGDGRWINILRDNGVQANFYGVDLVQRLKDKSINFKVGDARDLPYKSNSFDLVYSCGVVEHFPETPKSIKEHARVVKEGGTVFLFAIPHLSLITPYRYFKFFKEDNDVSFESAKGRNLTIRYLKKCCEKAGLDVKKCEGHGDVFLPIINRSARLTIGINSLFSKYFGNYIYADTIKRRQDV